jgi:all-trans-retinol 13,14-reductase
MYELFPEFRGKLEHLEISTPLTTRHYLANVEGETYGLASTIARFQKGESGPWSGVKGLYFSGQDTLFLGIYGALVSGILAAGAIHPLGTISELLPTGIFEQ